MTYSVYPSTIGTQPLQYARDWLTGYRGEYLFFRGGEDEYYIIRGDIDFETMTCPDARVDLIYYAYSDRNGRYYQIATFEHQDVTVSGSAGMLLYASDEKFPHLISGGEFYVFQTVCLLVFGFVLCAFNAVFRLVSKK